MRLWILLLATFLVSLPGPMALAHEVHASHPALKSPAVVRLEEFLEQARAERLRAEALHPPLSAEQVRTAELAGELLLEAVYDEIVVGLKLEGPPTALDKSAELAKGVLKRFNPVALGRWILAAARTHGPALAVAYGVSEALEQTGVLLTVKYPELVFLLPFYLTHASDVVVIGAFFTVPKIKRAVSRWKLHGGWWKGPRGYYEHLVRQRQAAPIDWNVVIATPEFENVSFAVLAEGKIERRLPRALKILFNPRALAQRETSPTLGLWELERIARRHGVELFAYKPFKNEPQLYLRMLLRELGRDANARRELAGRLALLAAVAPEPRLDTSGATPDLIAERWLWQLRQRRDHLKHELEEQTGRVTREQRKLLRQLSRLLEGNGVLPRLAATSFTGTGSSGSGAVESAVLLEAALREVETLFETLEASIARRECERLLSTQ